MAKILSVLLLLVAYVSLGSSSTIIKTDTETSGDVKYTNIPGGWQYGVHRDAEFVDDHNTYSVVVPAGYRVTLVIEYTQSISYPSAGTLLIDNPNTECCLSELKVDGVYKMTSEESFAIDLHSHAVYLSTGYSNCAYYELSVVYEKIVPDLSIEQLKVSPSTAAEDEEVTLSYVVKNNGGVKSAATTSSVYDGDTKLGSDHNVPELAAGSSHNVQLTLKTQTVGNHSMKALVSAVSGEVSTGNNESTVSLRLYARVPVAVKFDAQGGEGGETRQILAGNAIGSFPSVKKDGYTFAGWSSDSSVLCAVNPNAKVIDDTTYYAIWTKIATVKIVLVGNGGVGDSVEYAVNSGDIIKLPTSGFFNGGAVLVGWSTVGGYNNIMLFSGADVEVSNRSGSWYGQIVGADGDPVCIGGDVATITLYAVWGIEAYRNDMRTTENATNLLFMSSDSGTWCEYSSVTGNPYNCFSGAQKCTSAFRSNPDLTSYFYKKTVTKYGVVEYSGTNWLGAVVYGPGKLSFSPGTSCVSSGSIYFSIDGDRKSWILSGCGGYTPSYGITWRARETYDIPAGRHFVCWTFIAEDMIESRNSYNCVWVGDVKWTRNASSDYFIRYRRAENSTTFFEQPVQRDAVVALDDMRLLSGWFGTGKRFAGWRCSNGKRYDDGMLVFNLAEPGETVTMTAIWE